MALLFSRRATTKFLLLNPNLHHHRTLLNPPTLISSHSAPTRSHWSIGPRPALPVKIPPFPNPSAGSVGFHSTPPSEPDPKPPTDEDAEAARSAVEGLRKATSDLGWSLVALGAAHFGHWTQRWVQPPPPPPLIPEEVPSHTLDLLSLAPGVTTFAFPCALAFLALQAARAVRGLEGTGKLGGLTPFSLTTRASKQIEGLFLKSRVVALLCVVGICLEPFLNNVMK